MLLLTAMTGATARTPASPWMASLYAGLITAIIAIATSLLFQAGLLILWIIGLLLIGAGPVLGYQLASSKIGSDWKPILGGILSFILVPIGWLLWPILVGALDKSQSIGKLFIGTLIGLVIGLVAFFILASVIGQNPYWIATGFTALCSGWGGACGAAMQAWGTPAD
jgi:hypothetical protein